MFQSIGYTWDLMRASVAVLKRDKKLLVFPLLSMIACIIVCASFLVPALMKGTLLDAPPEQAPPATLISYYGFWFLFYFCNYFVMIFCNSCVVCCAIMRFRGQDPSVGDAINASIARLPQIIGWSIVSATVGVILKAIEERGKLGEFVSSLLGTAFTITSFLVIPILVVEKRGPFAALSRSAGLLGKTWGKQLTANFGFGLFFFLMMIPAIIGFVLFGMMMATSPTGAMVGMGFCILYVVFMSLVQSALQSIFQAALYLYVTESRGVEGFSEQMLMGAMAEK